MLVGIVFAIVTQVVPIGQESFSKGLDELGARWRGTDRGWQVRGGRLVSEKGGTWWLVRRGMLAPVRLKAEVEITPREGSREGEWGAAGLAVCLDRANYWRLALVESATDKSMHYMELVEKLGGVWQAQASGDTALEVLEAQGDGRWQFGHTYRFIIEIDGEQCAGTVMEGGRIIWRKVYRLGDSVRAVRWGWPALTVTDMVAEFDNLRAEGELMRVGKREGPPKGAIVDNELAEEWAPVVRWAREALQGAGFATSVLSASRFARLRLSGADYDVVVFPGPSRVPVGTGSAIEHYLSHAGALMVIADDVPFAEQLVRVGNRWVSPKQAQAEVEPSGVVMEVKPGLPGALDYQSNNKEREVSVEVERALAPVNGRVLHFRIPEFDGWNTWGVRVEPGALTADDPVLLFWARGDDKTGYLVIEVGEEDQSRWMATVPLSTRWQRYGLHPGDFSFWHDCPAAGKRGFPGDRVHPERVVYMRVGLAKSHAPLANGPKEFWVSSIRSGPLFMPATPDKLAIPSIEGIYPWYKTFVFPHAAEVRTADETVWPRVEVGWKSPLRCTYPRPWARTCTGVRTRRWMAILEARGGGYHAPVAAMLAAAGGPFAGATWSWWGFGPEAIGRLGKQLAPVFAAVARAHARRVWMVEAGASQVAFMPDQTKRWGATVANATAEPVSVELVLRARRDGEAAGQFRRRVTVPAMDQMTVVEEWEPPGPGEYLVEAELRVDGKTIDTITAPVRVVSRMAPGSPAEKYVRRVGGQFVVGAHMVQDKSGSLWVGGRPWFPHGVNFWPRYVSGMARSDYWAGWQHREHYDPVLVEEDLAIAESLGITALSIQAPRAAQDLPCLWDFLERCAAHNIYVNLFVACDPRGFDADYVRTIIKGGRLAGFHSLYAYDITWEPRWGEYKQRKRWDGQWERWVVDQYGSVEAAEKVWGISAPRDGDGNLTGPTDDQLFNDGPWRVMVAAYRRFVDDFLSAGYGRSCRFIRRLDGHHLISNRAGWGGTGNLHTVRRFQFDPLSGAAHLDFISPEGYGIRAEEGDYRRWGFVDAYCRWAGNGKPTFWSEYGASIHPGYTPEDYERQRLIWENVQRLVVMAGANGDAGWWWPGGYRVGERSDFGCIEPWGEPRPSALELKKWAGRICKRGREARPVRWITIDRDSQVRGLAGLWQEHLDEYLRLADGEHVVKLKTAGDGKTSVTVDMVGVGNVPWRGVGPVKYLNSEVTRAAVAVGDKEYEPADDMLWGDILVDVPAGKPAVLRLTLLNTGEASWACRKSAGDRPGAVRLVDVESGRALVWLPRDVPRYGTATVRVDIGSTPARGAERRLTLQLEAAGRCRFGQRIRIVLRGR